MTQSGEHLVLHNNVIFRIINYMATCDKILIMDYSLYPDSGGEYIGWKALDLTLVTDILFIGF